MDHEPSAGRTPGLGFAYQLVFLRLKGHLPHQKALEVVSDLLHIVALQLGHSENEATNEIERVIAEAHEEKLAGLELDLLSRVSLVGWENVALYGDYGLRPHLVRA